MIEEAISAETKWLIEKYLSPITRGVWTISNTCVTARKVNRYNTLPDATVYRVMIEEPDTWTVALEVSMRAGALWRWKVEGYYDAGDDLGIDGVRDAYVEWLRAL